MRGVNASFAQKGSRLCQLMLLERNRSSGYGWGHFSHITVRLREWYWDHLPPSSPDDFNDRTLEYGDVNRVKTGGIFSQQLSVTTSRLLFERASLFSAATNTVTFPQRTTPPLTPLG
jgi:hypothetical protein